MNELPTYPRETLEVKHHPRIYGDAVEFKWDPSRTYEQKTAAMKPRGFWVSIDNDWETWCKENCMEGWIEEHSPVDFLLNTDDLFWLKTPESIDFFTYLFKAEDPGGWNSYRDDSFYINWEHVVSKGMKGIIIAPYQWSRRMNVNWYYSWDCASACIWDLSALTLVSEIASRKSDEFVEI